MGTGLLLVYVVFLCFMVMGFCLVFVNAVEYFGGQIGMSDTAAGSILASFGTATPETLVPLIAILFVGSGAAGGGGHGEEIGIGAILGAPFMLTTVALGVVGISGAIGVFTKSRTSPNLMLEPGILRNFKYFFTFYPLAIIAGLIHSRTLNIILGIGLLLGYAYYVWQTLKLPEAEGEKEEEEHASLWFNKIFKFKEPPLWLTILQMLVGFVMMAYIIYVFAAKLGDLAVALGIPAVILSLIVAPLATELPEVGGASIFWTLRKKDTLALGNITGAMVYQSSIAVCIGLFLTPWVLTKDIAISIVLALLSAGIMFAYYLIKKGLSCWIVMVGNVFYVIYLIYIL
ncbi:MAG: hypothetical protein QME06_08820 [Desulfobacterales bacterium]|nr:hypothetical protein [Desulfobacterales bacterium]